MLRDKRWIIWGALCAADAGSYLLYDKANDKWSLDTAKWTATCDAIRKAGANAVRIFPYGVWGPRPYKRKSQFCPYQLDPTTGKWDLLKWRKDYFPVMRKMFKIANDAGMTVWFPWFDNCQFAGTYKYYSPWANNIQGTSTFYDKAADKWCYYWVRMLLRKFDGLDMFYPWGNELKETKIAAEWARRVLFPAIKEFKIPFDKMAYGFTMDERTYLGKGQFYDKPDTQQDIVRKWFGIDFPPEKNKTLLIREVHKCGTLPVDTYCPDGARPAQSANWWKHPATGPYGWSTDGVKEWKNPLDGGRPTVPHILAMTQRAFSHKNCIAFEYCPEGGTLAYQVGAIRAISASYRIRHGKWPSNYRTA